MATPSKVQPLRITKSTGSDSHLSPNKMASPRPLAEIGSTERRRNSPSYNQATKKMIVSRETSPYTENSFTKDSSPRNFWSLKDAMSPSRFDSENTPEPSSSPALLSPTRRASIERLKQAGRVKTSNIFALESKTVYDPANVPIVERPSANRPLSQQLANNSFARYDSLRKENNPLRSPQSAATQRHSESRLSTTTKSSLSGSPRKGGGSPSPTKSSLARTSQFSSTLYDPESSIWSEDDERKLTPRGLRQNKSVTFREEPPIINEYEQPTPEPSISATSDSREGSWDSDEYDDQDYSFERGSSVEHHDDSFDDDLENADKTPVVLPEQWSRVSPECARTDLVDENDDVFNSSTSESQRRVLSRSASVASDGSSRPLPPIPGRSRDNRNSPFSSAAERASSATRSLPSPPQRASCSKDDILSIARNSPLTFDQRMELMGKNTAAKQPHSPSTIAKFNAAEELTVTELEGSVVHHEAAGGAFEESETAQSPPRISRESILRKVRSRRFDLEDEQAISPIDERYADLDPDQPIPSRETSQETSSQHIATSVREEMNLEEVVIKEEPVDDHGFDMLSIPDAPALGGAYGTSDLERQSSVLRHRLPEEIDDDASETRHSTVEPEAESTFLHAQYESTPEVQDGKETLNDAMQLLSVKDYSQPEGSASKPARKSFMGLPSYVSTDDYDFGIHKFIAADSPPASEENTKEKIDITASAPVLAPPTQPKATPYKDLPRPAYDGAEFSPPHTPESVIHHNEDVSALEDGGLPEPALEDARPVSPIEPERSIEIPERRATIRTGGKLKTRPSATPADLHAMAEQRRIVSAEKSMPSVAQEDESGYQGTSDVDLSAGAELLRKDLDLSLNVPSLDVEDGLCLDKEFDRVIESQKKGYLMRQNTKVVVASNRNFSNESNATAKSNDSGASAVPRSGNKASSRGAGNSSRTEQYLKTEPWNGKTRRQSQRVASACPSEPAPPMPGHQSALGVVEEDFAAGTSSLEDEVGDDVERGRLFVKVVGIKNLDLPLPRNDRTYFQLTLDNGLHCVTTSDLEMGKSAVIGQEFELVVLNDLEFQLTLTTRLPPPPREPQTFSSSSAAAKKGASKGAALSRFLTSPKKRAERERQEREALEAEERQRKEELLRKRASVQPTAWDLLHDLVSNTDGSFARAYVNLKAHEKDCFGRALTVDIPCYNEWALEKDADVINSVRNKRGTNTGPIRRPPYVIGHLELQLLYIPRPKDAVEEDMPKSMSAALREISRADKEASENVEVTHEGHLSQQGGDCQHWRRRFFRLQGPKLTAYHEHTNQKRAVINLSKASRLVDDKSTLVADPVAASTSRAKRRKSAFAEEDEGYAYVEEGFRIRFANGETIDFYADTHAAKVSWMKKLAQVIGKPAVSATKRHLKWTDLVLAREKLERPGSAETLTSVKDFGAQARAARSAPSSPIKKSSGLTGPPVPEKEKRPSTPPMSERRGHRDRNAVKSMIF